MPVNAATTPTPAVLEAREISVSLQGTQILHQVSLQANAGEVVALMGGNGSGKSTFVRALVGATPVSGGEVALWGQPATPPARTRVGYVPQRMSAAGGVAATAAEVVASGLLGHRRLRPERSARTVRDSVMHALSTLGVDDLASRDVSQLSGGQQQRVLIARALVRQPGLLILDEPLAGVDLQSQVAFAHALGHLKEDGVAIVVVLHELGALGRHIDTSVVLEAGRVTYAGKPPRDLGVHALPGHDHEHPHDDHDAGHARPGLGLEAP